MHSSPQAPMFRVKYYPCGSNLPISQQDTSTWPVYSSNDIPDIASLQNQLANFDSTIQPSTQLYLWDDVARRPVPIQPTDTLQPGDSAVLVFAKPEFNGAQAIQLMATQLAAVDCKLGKLDGMEKKLEEVDKKLESGGPLACIKCTGQGPLPSYFATHVLALALRLCSCCRGTGSSFRR